MAADLTEEPNSALIAELIRRFVPDHDREGLRETPSRFIRALTHWTSGYRMFPEHVLKMFTDGANGYDELVIETNIPIWSLCEHHLAPFFGVAHVGYIPAKKVVGLSKLPRLIDIFAHRLQVQERLTIQIADALHQFLEPVGAGVVLECRHTCMESRGIERSGIVTTTSALRGALREKPEARAEFLSLVKSAKRPQ